MSDQEKAGEHTPQITSSFAAKTATQKRVADWTPEPWFANDPEYPRFLFHVNDEWQVAIFEEPVDAIRAAACVNACEGLNPEGIPELVTACRQLINIAESEWNDDQHTDKVKACERALIAIATGNHHPVTTNKN